MKLERRSALPSELCGNSKESVRVLHVHGRCVEIHDAASGDSTRDALSVKQEADFDSMIFK